jgi:hypothetical protein
MSGNGTRDITFALGDNCLADTPYASDDTAVYSDSGDPDGAVVAPLDDALPVLWVRGLDHIDGVIAMDEPTSEYLDEQECYFKRPNKSDLPNDRPEPIQPDAGQNTTLS